MPSTDTIIFATVACETLMALMLLYAIATDDGSEHRRRVWMTVFRLGQACIILLLLVAAWAVI